MKYRSIITDVIVPFLTATESKRGPSKRLDLTTVVCGIVYVLHEGIRWRALPPVFGNWSSVYCRFDRWAKKGLLETLFELIREQQSTGETFSLDSSHIKVHQDANVKNPEEQAVGSTRGGKNTKLHAVVDESGHAVRLDLTPGNLNDNLHAEPMLSGLKPGDTIIADKAYDTNAIRHYIEEHFQTACIPPKSNRRNPAEYDKDQYKTRSGVENFYQRAKRCRRIGTRYEKTKLMFLSFVFLFAVLDYHLH